MVTDRQFSHPNFGNSARVEQHGCEVRLIFTAHSLERATDFTDFIVNQLKSGALNLTVMGKPSKVIEH
jgi:hypothetical protein